MSTQLIDIAFLIGSGRVNVEIEQRCFDAVAADGMADFACKMRAASAETINAVWSLVKATQAGSELK